MISGSCIKSSKTLVWFVKVNLTSAKLWHARFRHDSDAIIRYMDLPTLKQPCHTCLAVKCKIMPIRYVIPSLKNNAMVIDLLLCRATLIRINS